MASKRMNHDGGLKARVAMGVLKGERNVSELAAEYGVRQNWRVFDANSERRSCYSIGKRRFSKVTVDGETVGSLQARIG